TTGNRIWNTTSGYRFGNRKVIAQFAKRYQIKYPEPESTVNLLKQNFQVVEAKANMFERAGGVSSITTFKSIRYMVDVCSS
ncbi:glycosyltransferase family 2 protein, partial [Streptococcus suis]